MISSETLADQMIDRHCACITEAAQETFASVCGMEIAVADEQRVETRDGVILSVISLVGDIEWSVILGLPSGTAAAAAAKFAGFEIPFESEDMGDAIGELTNIFAGLVKSKLDATGIKVEISLPSVVRAKGLEVLVQRKATSMKIIFTSEAGLLWAGVVAGQAAAGLGG